METHWVWETWVGFTLQGQGAFSVGIHNLETFTVTVRSDRLTLWGTGNLPSGRMPLRGHILHERYSLEDVPRGPFTSETQFYESLVKAFLQHAEILPLSHPCFIVLIPWDYQSDTQYRGACDLWNDFVTVGGKIDSSDNRLDFISAGNTLQRIIQQWRLMLPKTTPGSFPLCHADLSVNNIYVEDNYNITCIIDWAFSSSVPEAMLLTPPGLPQSRNELSQDLIFAFRRGFSAAMSSTLQVEDMGSLTHNTKHFKLLEQSRCAWLLARLLNFDSTDDYSLFAAIWRVIYGAEQSMEAYFSDQRSSSRYIQRYSEVQLEDEPVQEIQRAERSHFRKDILSSSVARKLTLMSQWKCQYVSPNHRTLRKEGELFVADSKLWKWIMEIRQGWKDVSRWAI